jgi:hypothetical protein
MLSNLTSSDGKPNLYCDAGATSWAIFGNPHTLRRNLGNGQPYGSNTARCLIERSQRCLLLVYKHYAPVATYKFPSSSVVIPSLVTSTVETHWQTPKLSPY